MPRVKIFDTQKAAQIIRARMTLAELRDEPLSLIRRAQLGKANGKLARKVASKAHGFLLALMAEETETAEGVERIGGDGDCQPGLSMKLTDSLAEIYCYDAIDDQYGISDEQYIEALDKADGRPLRHYINSPGGYVSEARAISSQIRRYAQKQPDTVSIVDSMCASAATTIALGANRLELNRGAEMMIHKCWGVIQTNADQMTTSRKTSTGRT